jgi:uncharacterized OB-fold protein
MIENITVPGTWDINYEYAAGDTASHFLTELRDNEQILGRQCPECERVLAPPREFCEQCYCNTDEWVEIGPGGRIESFTIVPNDLGSGPEAPYAVAYVQLDGASTAMVNMVEGLDLSDVDAAAAELSIGTRVEAVFNSDAKREARITDFHYELA